MYQLPTVEEMDEALRALAQARARIAELEVTIELREARLTVKYRDVRNAVVRRFGATEAEIAEAEHLYRELAAAKQALYDAQARVSLLEFRRDLCRIATYAVH